MQEFLARNKTDSRSVLVELLRQILTSNCTELRKSVIAWLVSIGQFSLIAEIDGEGTDKALTGNICEMLMTEDILEPKTAIDNLRFLVDNLSTRKEWKATLKAIQLLLDNTHCLKINPSDTGSTDAGNNTPKSFADRIHEVYNSFLGLKNSTNYLELSPDVITEYTS